MEGKAPALPEIQMALLVDDFGPGALGASPDFFDLLRIREVLHIRDVFKLAGTPEQRQLTQGEWRMVRDINAMAAEEARKNAE